MSEAKCWFCDGNKKMFGKHDEETGLTPIVDCEVCVGIIDGSPTSATIFPAYKCPKCGSEDTNISWGNNTRKHICLECLWDLMNPPPIPHPFD